MEKEDEKFFYEDEVAMSSKTGLVKYGLVLTTNRHKSESELQMNNYKSPNDIKVIWHPNGTEEILPDDKVYLFIFSLNVSKTCNYFNFLGCINGSVTDAW